MHHIRPEDMDSVPGPLSTLEDLVGAHGLPGDSSAALVGMSARFGCHSADAAPGNFGMGTTVNSILAASNNNGMGMSYFLYNIFIIMPIFQT